MFANLVSNASKFSGDGAGIFVFWEPQGSAGVWVRVRDAGMGMAPQLLDSVFDLFVQRDASLDCARGGLGIGLTVVRALVEMHGGRVHAASDGLDRGSEFVVELPLLQAEAPDAPRHAGKRPMRSAPP